MYSVKVSGLCLKLKKYSKTQKEKRTCRVGNFKKNNEVFGNFFLKHAKNKKKNLQKKKNAINYLIILLACILNLEYSYK